MSTLQAVELGVLGPLQVRRDGAPVTIPGAKPRTILTMLGLHGGSVLSAEKLIELLWGDDPPRTAAKALQTHISSLRRTLGDGFVLTQGTGWILSESETDASRYKLATRMGRDAAAAGDTSQAVARFDEALTLWRGIPELPDTRRGISEKTRWIEGHAALVEDRADALLATGRAAEIIGELEAAVADAPLRERRWGQLMLALYRAGRQGEALAAYQRARSLLADELGVDPGPELRRLEAAIVAQDAALDTPVVQHVSSVTRAVTFLLTDIEGSTAAWEANAEAMAVALARHDELVEQVVTSRGGRLIKTRGEGDAAFSVFERPSAAAAAAMELQDAILHEPWALLEPMRIRVALHTGEAELRDGDYFGRAVNRAARLRSLATGGQILCSGATVELVIDSLPDDVVLADLGMRQLKNLARPEHVFELRVRTAVDSPQEQTSDVPFERPSLPAVLTGPGPFVGRASELERLLSAWQTAVAGGMHAVLIAGEPGVGKTRLAGEWSQQVYQQGAVVLYGRCDEDLGAPYQPFAEALRSLVPCIGEKRLRGLRGIEALLPLVPGLTDVLPDLAPPTRADPDTERYALFDAVVAVLQVASISAPVVLILDDLHWAAKPTLLLLRHLLRFGDQARVQIVGTYRSTDLDRSHPLAAMLADLHRDGTADRLNLSGLDDEDVTTYVAEAGYDDEELANALASVTGGNPFFLIEALRHVDESGGVWDQSTLPQGVREAVSRRLSRLPAETNKALAAAAVVGSRFAVDLVEQVVDQDLVDAFDEACKAGIVIEEPGGYYRFNHAIVRQSLLAELASVRRMRLHQRIAATLEAQPGADDERLAELAHHYFECAWAGNAVKAVEYCRRAADQAMARLAYEGAADLYDRALHAMEELDDELPDRDDQAAELLVARCEALLAAGDVASAAGAVSQLQAATVDSAQLAAWATCFDGQLSMLIHPERLDEVEAALDAAAEKLAGLDDAAGEAKAQTVRATCLARLGRIADCEIALDQALTAARRARDHRRVNAVLAGAPLAALWGPNPVPRAGGRCLDVVRLLRITTDSPAVEATSTRCQAVLEAFRGRAAAARRMIDSARRTVTELGLRHALLEVEQFAGIVELVADDPAAAEAPLRQAYNGFRRMGLDADTAETAALLGRTCLALGRDAEADELCSESERLAGNALKASIAWRTLRAQLLSRRGEHAEARRVAEVAVGVAERTDALVDHGDACLALATVLSAAGDATGARAAAERAVGLYERKGAGALAEKARHILGERPAPAAPPKAPSVEATNACVQAGIQLIAAVHREAWDEVVPLFAPYVSIESQRKIVGFPRTTIPSSKWPDDMRLFLRSGLVRYRPEAIAVRGERLAVMRLEVGTADTSPGAPQDEMVQLIGLDEQGRIALEVSFDIEDVDVAIAELDAAYARFEDGQRKSRRLENAASRADDRFNTLFAGKRWDDIGTLLTDDIRVEDRRRGLRRDGNDRATELAELRAIADLGVKDMASDVLAIRGERLALVRTLYAGQDKRPEAFHTEVLRIAEIDADERIVAYVAFDLDDVDAAIAELDARYLTGEAADNAHTWSAIASAFVAINRQELPERTPNWVNIDRRHGAAFATGEMTAYIHDLFNDSPDIKVYIEVVHRLSDLGVVVTHAARGTSHQGFEAEWREIAIFTFDGGLLSRCELFDEADLDTALARFDQLNRPAPRLENAASQAYERIWTYYSARDWEAITEIVSEHFSSDDRRRVVNAGIRHGRGADIQDLQAAADIGFTITMVDVTATRGDRLALTRVRGSGPDPEAIQNDAPNLVEIDTDGQIAAVVVFDLEDIDAAFEELDARYLAGEAAAHSDTWSVISQAYAALKRRALPATTPDWTSIDHRRFGTVEANALTPNIRAWWDLMSEFRIDIETVHRLSNLGAVVTHTHHATSHDGLGIESREIVILMVEGGLLSSCEIFGEADLDAALDRFEELQPHTRRLENAAARVIGRVYPYYAARDWDAVAQMAADNYSIDDRRRIVNVGIRHGRDAGTEELQATADVGFTMTMMGAVATRGERLVLTRVRGAGRDPETIQNDALNVVEIDADEKVSAVVVFDLEDFDAAIAELEARYLAGEAAAHAHTWSAVLRPYTAINRREIFETTPDWVSIDHRRGAAFAPGDANAYVRASLDDGAGSIYVETVHRLSDLGAVVTWTATGTTEQGFDAEWRGIHVLTVDGDLLSRFEVFDEADLYAALARFDQLSQPAPRLENAASRVCERYLAHFAARDWDALAEVLANDISVDDRRRVVNAGTRHGRDAEIANLRATADAGFTHITSVVIAARGERLILTRTAGHDRGSEEFLSDALGVLEISSHNQIAAIVIFDLDDFDAAIAELDARYIAGEAAAYARTWSVITGAFDALNGRELPPMTPDWVNIDHRRGTSIAPGEMPALLNAAWNVTSDLSNFIEAVHRLDNLGAVITHVANETSQEGFHAEWRVISLLALDGDLVNRCEVFDDADLDAAITRFDQLSRPMPRLENAATQVYERLNSYFAAREWAAMAEILAGDVSTDDRRRVVNAGLRTGRDAVIAEISGFAEIGVTDVAADIIATRGRHLALSRSQSLGRTQPVDAFQAEAIHVIEIDADERIAAIDVFDVEDIEAAFKELDARYLAGEAAPYSRTWCLVAAAYACYNRRELPATTPDWVNVDRRRMTMYAPGDVFKYVQGGWNYISDISFRIEAVHRLSDLGAVVTQAGRGTSREGFDAEWREIHLMTVEGDLFNRSEMFDEADLDAALARFEELHPQTRRLENAASQVTQRFLAHFAAGDWDAIAETLADDFCQDDRRRVVGAGVRHGRDAEIADLRAIADHQITELTSTVIATRGERLALLRCRFAFRDQGPEAFVAELLGLGEIDADGRIIADVSFDLDEFDAAIAELDARYLAGEAAAYARTWSVITGSYAAINRHEQPPITPDWITVDHRRETAMGPGDLIAYIGAGSDRELDNNSYAESVHRLDKLGAVITYAARETSKEGFNAEWRGLAVFTLEGDLINRCEVFDEADIDSALARFDELSRPAPRLENTASQAIAQYVAHFAARDWDALGKLLADNIITDDRRRGVNAGIRQGRDAEIAILRATADVGLGANVTSFVIASRGERLILARASIREPGPEEFFTEVLGVAEVNSHNQIAAIVVFELDDFDAAIAELDARYLAGEAAPYAKTYRIISDAYAAMNRHELFATTPDWVNVDHRQPGIIEEGGLNASLESLWQLIPDVCFRVEAVHRLTEIGAVCSHVAQGVSHDGFDAEWRGIEVMTVDHHLINRCEIFDEGDLDAALTRFEELHPQKRRLGNAASRADDRFFEHTRARNWAAMAEILADKSFVDDRRRVVNIGVWDGRDVLIANFQTLADALADVTSTVIATRGERLALTRICAPNRDPQQGDFGVEMLGIAELDTDDRLAAHVLFDVDDIDAAFEELDGRYLAGEAAPYAQTWSVIAEARAAFNRHETPTMAPDLASIDHRRGIAFSPGEFIPYVQAALDVAPDIKNHIDVVHRLSNLGVVVTQGTYGTSQEGFDAEWREIVLLTVEGDLINRCEIFDEADLEAALARFDELQPRAPRPENAASQVEQRFLTYFAARDWDAIAELIAEDACVDDRRRVVNAGVRHGRDAEIASQRAIADVGVTNATSTVIAVRGGRLFLGRHCVWSLWSGAKANETLCILEINAENQIAARILFDNDDIDSAFEELDARYLAGEAAAHSHAWSVVAEAYAAFNRHELPAADWVTLDRRRVTPFDSSTMSETLRAIWDLTPDLNIRIEAVHRLGSSGAVVSHTGHGTSEDGFYAEWRAIDFLTIAGGRITCCEIFDEADIDAALARFDELHPQTRRLDNAASQVDERFWTSYAARDWRAMAELLAENVSTDDRRRVVNAGMLRGRDDHIESMRALAELEANMTSAIIATRGERLALTHLNRDLSPGDFGSELLYLVEIDADHRITAGVFLDSDDIDAALGELDARYLAGEAAAHTQTWTAMTQVQAAYNRHEFPPTTTDCVNIDHRRGRAFAPGDVMPYIRATYDVAPNVKGHIEAVHRLSNRGVVITEMVTGTSQDGFAFEWREIALFAFEGDMVSRFEMFDEVDLDAAIARFDDLRPPAPRLENAACRMGDRFLAHFAASEWDAMAEMLADNHFTDDRRRVVGAGVRHGREAQIADFRALAGLFTTTVTLTAIATRGERLVLRRARFSDNDHGPKAFVTESLTVGEIDADEKIVAFVTFDLDDIDGAFEELDARYLAGEAAAYAHTWSVITRAYAALNRHVVPATTPDCVYIDHRRTIASAGDMVPYVHATWNVVPDIKMYISAVHRLTSRGAVVTWTTYGTSQEGFDAEWRGINILTVEGDLIDHGEIFDETDIDAALAQFDELTPSARQLENLATRVWQGFQACLAAGDWAAMAKTATEDMVSDDRRRVVGAGIQRGRDVNLANINATLDVGIENVKSTVIAIRGERLVLDRLHFAGHDQAPEPFHTEMLRILELDADARISAAVFLDLDDIDAAFQELDARYLAGEAFAYTHIWSLMTQNYAALNRHELPATTSDLVNIDHRRGRAFEAGDIIEYVRATWDIVPDVKMHIEAVHRLTNIGAVVTQVAKGTSLDGFDAEWREIALFTFEGDLFNRCEIFDETDLDTALARFDELDRPAP